MDDQDVLRVRDSDRTPSRAGVILLCLSAQFGKEWNHEPTVSAKSWRKAGGDGRHEGCRTARARARCRKPPKWPRTTTHRRHRPVNISAIWAQNIPNKQKVVGHPQNMASTPNFTAPEEGYLHDIASERSEEATRSCSGHYFVIMFNFMRIGQEMSCQHGCDRRAPRWARNALLLTAGLREGRGNCADSAP